MGPTSKISDAEITSFLVIEVPFTYFNRKVDLCVKKGVSLSAQQFSKKNTQKRGQVGFGNECCWNAFSIIV